VRGASVHWPERRGREGNRRECPQSHEATGPGDALLVVDVQNDFLPAVPLGIGGGDSVLAPLNRLLGAWRALGLPVYLTRDWHPPGHCSFAERGGPWPVHCVAGTAGAEFSPRLERVPGDVVISKATRPDRDAYSALDGTGSRTKFAAPACAASSWADSRPTTACEPRASTRGPRGSRSWCCATPSAP